MKLGFWVPAYKGDMRVEIARQMILDWKAVATAGHQYNYWWADSTDIAQMRNRAVAYAHDLGLDYLMMQDSDIFCPDNESPMAMLLETAEKYSATLVGAICGLRRISMESVVPNCRPYHEGKVYEADRVGTGMVLINVKRLRELDYTGPWFARTYKDDRQCEGDYGEDFFFCKVLDGLGEDIWVDGRVPTNHAHTNLTHLKYPATHPGLHVK